MTERQAFEEAFGDYFGKNRAFKGAAWKGWKASASLLPRSSPYDDIRGGRYGSMITYSRAFEKAWLEGYDRRTKWAARSKLEGGA